MRFGKGKKYTSLAYHAQNFCVVSFPWQTNKNKKRFFFFNFIWADIKPNNRFDSCTVSRFFVVVGRSNEKKKLNRNADINETRTESGRHKKGTEFDTIHLYLERK